MIGMRDDLGAFAWFLIVIFLVIMVTFSLAQVMSSFASNTNMAIGLYMFVMVFSLLAGGFMINFQQASESVSWIRFMSYFYFGYEGLVLNEFRGDPNEDQVLRDTGFPNHVFLYDVYPLIGYLVFLRLMSYTFLRFRQRELR